MVKLEPGVPPAAATRPCTARPSIFQHCPGGEEMLLLDTTLFQGVCWHFGRGRAWMPMGLLGSMAGGPISKWDGVGTVPTEGGTTHAPPASLPSPRLLLVGWSSHDWGGDAATSCPTSALPPTLLSLGFIPALWMQE